MIFDTIIIVNIHATAQGDFMEVRRTYEGLLNDQRVELPLKANIFKHFGALVVAGVVPDVVAVADVVVVVAAVVFVVAAVVAGVVGVGGVVVSGGVVGVGVGV